MSNLTAILRKAEATIRNLKIKIRFPAQIGPYGFLTILSALVYGVVFSYFTFLRHDSFYSAGWDLGNFNQAFFTTIYDGKLFYYTADSFFSPSGSLFAIHTSPILFLLLPLYALSPSSATLLVIKAFGIGLAAIPLYLLSKELLKSSKAGFSVSLIYLLYAPLHGANWFDFQQSAFLPLLVFLTYYLMVKKNWKLYFPALLLTLMVEEHVAVVLAILAVFYFSYNSDLRSFPKSLRQLRLNESMVLVLTVAICVVYLLSALLIKNMFPVDPDFAGVYGARGNYEVLGSSETFSLPIYAVLHPVRAFNALSYDFAVKFFYVVFLFAPLLFIPLRNRFALGILFILSPFLLSNYRPYYTLGVHYPFYIIPVAFIATIYGLRRLELSSRAFNLRTMMVVTMLFTVSVSPLSSLSTVFVSQGFAYYSPIEFSLNEKQKSLKELVSIVPSDASVLTQNLIFPHLSSRSDAYMIPFSDYGKPEEMSEYIDGLLNNSEYVLLDLAALDAVSEAIMRKISDDGLYRPYALGRLAILFKRGYHEEPINVQYANNRVYLAYTDLILASPPGGLIDDPFSTSGTVLFYPKDYVGYCAFGPYDYLLQGSYEATFMVKFGEHDDSCLCMFDISTDRSVNVLSFRDVYGFEMKANEWVNVTVPFSLPEISTGMEFRVFSTGKTSVYVDRVIIDRKSSVARLGFDMQTLRVRNLWLANGYVSEEGFFVHARGATNRVFWYGPYWSYEPGNYSVTFHLKTSPTPEESDRPVLTLDVWGRKSEGDEPFALNERTVWTQEFFAGGGTSEWRSFTLNFAIEEPFLEIEFRGLWPSPDYDVYLSFIVLERLS